MSHGVYDTVHIENALGGQMGASYITDTNAHTFTDANFYIQILIVEDTVFATLTDPDVDGTLTGVTVVKGTVLHGHFTEIKLTSGKVYALKGQ